MITTQEAEDLIKKSGKLYTLDLHSSYTTASYNWKYIIARDKCDDHLAILIDHIKKEILYQCDHTTLGRRVLSLLGES